VSDYYYHYCDRWRSQGICAVGKITPPAPGQPIYLTDQLFGNGADASNSLGIDHKAVEVCFAVPRTRVRGVMGPDPVTAVRRTGVTVRRGGGVEYRTLWEVDVTGCLVLQMRVP